MSRTVSAAAGVFAPGHLGELTRIVPFEMVDEVLAETGAVQQRVRLLPSRVVVYLVLAAALFAGVGYPGVWRKLVAGLGALAPRAPAAAAMQQARLRVGVKPFKALFDLLRGSASAVRKASTRWDGLLVCAIDGTTLTVPDSAGNTARLGKHGGGHGPAGYPKLRLLVLVACGTRAVIDAVWGPMSEGEPGYARRLLRSLRDGMIVLLDRNFNSYALLEAIHGTGAEFLVRLTANRRLPVLRRYPDGSYLSRAGKVEVRVVECEITIKTKAGTKTGAYRLATTLLDPSHNPAVELVKLYHERWVRHEVAWNEWNSLKEDRLMSTA